MGECLFLTRLPAELRVRVYEHVLAFDRPLKLRQVVAGSKNTSILRLNSQINREAVPVFYSINTIMVTRNDFCQDTDPDLQTPFRKDQVRNLLIRNFSQSIRCSSFSGGNNMYLAGCCDVCKPSAFGFVAALGTLPRIQNVFVDYHHHPREFSFAKSSIQELDSTRSGVDANMSIRCIGMACYEVTSPSLPRGLMVTFVDLPFHTIWGVFASLETTLSSFGWTGERQLLDRMRDEEDRALPDKLYLLHCAKQSRLWRVVFKRLAELWENVDTAIAEGRGAGQELEALTHDVKRFCQSHTAEDARMQLSLLRNEDATFLDWQADPQLW